jgi:hypothetical protein
MTSITPYLLKIAAPDAHHPPVFVGFVGFCVPQKKFINGFSLLTVNIARRSVQKRSQTSADCGVWNWVASNFGFGFRPSDSDLRASEHEQVSVLTIDTFGASHRLIQRPANCAWSIRERFTPPSIAGIGARTFSRMIGTANNFLRRWRKPAGRRNRGKGGMASPFYHGAH